MSHKFIRSTDNPGAVLNTDKKSLEAYKRRKKMLQEQNQRIENLENKFDDVLNILKNISEKLEEKDKCQ